MMNQETTFTGNEGFQLVCVECRQGKTDRRISSLKGLNIFRTRGKGMRISLPLVIIIALLIITGLEKGKAQIANPGTAPVTMLPASDPPSFSPGRLVVLKTTTTVSKSSSPITLQEFTTSGTQGATIIVPSSTINNYPLQTSGIYGGSEGFLTNSTDGKYLMLGGYATSASFADITATTAAAVARAVGLVTQSGFYSQLALSNVFYNQNDIRGSVSDGTNYWASGASVANVDGIDYYGPGAQAGLGTLATNPPKAYGLRIFGGDIYFSTQKQYGGLAANNYGIFKMTGLPTTNPVNITQVINTGAIIPEDFSFNPSMNVCYIAINLNTSNGGIQKWTKSGSVWSLAYTLGTGATNIGAYGLVADYSVPATPVLYATTFEAAGNRVIKITDNGTLASSPATTLVSASAGVFYKGISFSPVDSGTPIVNLDISTNSGSEAASTIVTVTAIASSPVATAQTVSLGVSGTGITTGDYTLSNSTITIPAGASTGTVTFTVVDDALFEPTETAILTISNPSSGMVLGATTTQNITILDNDNTVPTIAINTATTSDYIDGGVTVSPASPYTLSGVIADITDPASTLGIDFVINDNETPASGLTLTTISSNITVVPNANVVITGTGAIRNVKITPVSVGYSNISITVSDGVNNKTYVIAYAASARTPDIIPANTFWHTGMSDASDAIALDNNYYISGDDEFDYLNVYSRSASGFPAVSYDYSSNLALPDPGHPEVDLEAAAKSPSVANKMFWSGSMSNGAAPFPNKPNRDRLFATTVTGTGASTVFTFAGYVNIRTALLAWGDANGYAFTASATAGVDSKAPNGFSLEGMVFGPDNTTLYLGLRAPLVPVSNRTNAVIAPILNFESWFNNGSPVGSPAFGPPIELNLNNRGIRDIIRLSNGTYILIAGPAGDAGANDLYKWTGFPADAPVLVPSSASGVLKMEGIIPVYVNSQLSLSQIQVVTDGGDVVLYNDGFEAKDLVGNLRKFRSDLLTGLDLDICTGFTASITPGGSTTFCSGGSVTLVASGGTNINNTYLWSTGATTAAITVSTGGTYSVTVTHANLCSSIASQTVTVNPLPIPTISGSNSLCANSGYYTYTTEPGMTNYNWTISSGGTITAGSGTNVVQVVWPTADAQSLSVSYTNSNGCIPATPTFFPVTVNPVPGTAGSITGINNLCAGEQGISYSVAPIVNTVSYVWALPSGANIVTGSGTNSIIVNYSSNAVSGSLSVYGNNVCGNGPTSSLAITINPIPQTPVITANGQMLNSSASDGNQWYHNGTVVTGATSQSYNVPANQPGWYWTEVTLQNCSSDTSNHKYIQGVGIADNTDGQFSIYPVPNNGSFTAMISWPTDASFNLSIYNELGTRVFMKADIRVHSSVSQLIDLRPNPAGIYTVVLTSNDVKIIRKLIISN